MKFDCPICSKEAKCTGNTVTALSYECEDGHCFEKRFITLFDDTDYDVLAQIVNRELPTRNKPKKPRKKERRTSGQNKRYWLHMKVKEAGVRVLSQARTVYVSQKNIEKSKNKYVQRLIEEFGYALQLTI